MEATEALSEEVQEAQQETREAPPQQRPAMCEDPPLELIEPDPPGLRHRAQQQQQPRNFNDFLLQASRGQDPAGLFGGQDPAALFGGQARVSSHRVKCT